MTDEKFEDEGKNEEKETEHDDKNTSTKIAERSVHRPGFMTDLGHWIDDFRSSFLETFFAPFGDVLAPAMPFTGFPAVDIEATDTEYKIHAELPGIAKDEVTLTLEDGELKIRAEKKQEDEEKGKNYVRKERRYESFYRQIPVPDDVETTDEIDAKLEDGMLNITLKRKPEQPKDKKEIKVQ
jgi:HSP20 family protein